ncbi:aldehyde dehydrogenase [Rufibacter glacialis]|uniref:Aldehyde dehydrogenase n=1 Tax=Rufibacter glacialis TaxID=1259555 RepID=A0A5M8QQ62_9BACT|nr:aldehyde dehydrogenase [Rufibacter glacialis]KAA6437170.1 aldehyde dehydrogenase [Rufibacter glacialis]GGK61523.1 aldehyde dehydrogenase [Rufibacter glacialis]
MRPSESLNALVQQQKAFFNTGQTRPLAFRLQMLRRLGQAIAREEEAITAALAADFGKPPFETYATEIAILLSEIKFMERHLAKWTKLKRVKSSFLNFPSSDAIYAEPYGVSLVIGAWNYPFQLTLSPMLGAIAAGCCAILKPSELTPATSQLIARLIQEHFPAEYLAVVQGGPEVSQALLELPFDKIFFTGSVPVGRIVAQAAARQLIPVTLELGGKSPCLVDETANLTVAARRIVWGKFLNAGQTCVAPDYILVQEQVAGPLLEKLAQTLTDFYGANPAQSPDFARIINDRHFQRLQGLIDKERVYAGGETDASTRYMAPTLLSGITWDHPLMQDEIFGPLLPVLTYQDLPQAIAQVNARPKPLALYFFSEDKKAKEMVLTQTSSGGMCLNDTVSHLANPHLPFGGVGTSGHGNYHGKASFEAFSHQKSVLMKPSTPDLPLRYPPYQKKLDWMKRAFKWL